MRLATFVVLVSLLSPFIGVFLISEKVILPHWYKHAGPKATVLPELSTLAPSLKTTVVHNGDPEEEFGIAFDVVEIEVENGQYIRGWHIVGVGCADKACPGVVGVHGAGMDRRELSRHIPVLRENGFNVLAIDCREHGMSDGDAKGISYGVREQHDVVAAAEYAMETLKWSSVGAFGCSQGGTSSILAASRTSIIKAVVAENAFADVRDLLRSAFDSMRKGNAVTKEPDFFQRTISSLGELVPDAYIEWSMEFALWRVGAWNVDQDDLDAIDVVDDLNIPVLFIHGDADRLVPFEHSVRMHSEAKHPDSELWAVKGGDHAVLYQKEPEEYHRRLIRFFKKHLQ